MSTFVDEFVSTLQREALKKIPMKDELKMIEKQMKHEHMFGELDSTMAVFEESTTMHE